MIMTFLTSSWIIVLAVILFVSWKCDLKLTKLDYVAYTLLGSILHCISYVGLPRGISPFVTMAVLTILFANLTNTNIKKMFVSIFQWYMIDLVFEVVVYLIAFNMFKIDAVNIIGSMNYYIVSFVCNLSILGLTIIVTKEVSKWKDMVHGFGVKRQM